MEERGFILAVSVATSAGLSRFVLPSRLLIGKPLKPFFRILGRPSLSRTHPRSAQILIASGPAPATIRFDGLDGFPTRSRAANALVCSLGRRRQQFFLVLYSVPHSLRRKSCCSDPALGGIRTGP
jgi:hypothetical protein